MRSQVKKRNFGTFIDMEGHTDSAFKVTTMKENIYRTNINMYVAKLTHNALVLGINEFNPLHNAKSAQYVSHQIDGLTGQTYKNFGLSVNNPRHAIFLTAERGGAAIRHAGGAALACKARELEIFCNPSAA